MSETPLRLLAHTSIADIDRDAWNRLANPTGCAFDPFLAWDFLEALESSGAAAPESGWTPLHLTAETVAGEVIGALPLYAKTHSRVCIRP